MNLAQLEEGFYTSPQLNAGTVAELAAKGFKAIINNRPDGESGFYSDNAEMAMLAEQYGMEYRYIPVSMRGLTLATVEEMGKALDDLNGPVVAYCASGGRSANMWALAKAKTKSADDIITACAAQGHNVAQMRPIIEQLANAA